MTNIRTRILINICYSHPQGAEIEGKNIFQGFQSSEIEISESTTKTVRHTDTNTYKVASLMHTSYDKRFTYSYHIN